MPHLLPAVAMVSQWIVVAFKVVLGVNNVSNERQMKRYTRFSVQMMVIKVKM